MKDILHVLDRILIFQNLMALGIFTRLTIFILFIFFPFPYGSDPPISALHYQTGTDLAFYLPMQYLTADVNIIKGIFAGVQNLFRIDVPVNPLPGPIFPAFIWLTDYAPGNTLPLSALILLSELTAFIIWCYIYKTDFNGITGLLFCLMPHTIWFGVIISSDVFLYLFSAILFYLWSSKNKKLEKYILGLSAFTLLVRPGGLAFAISRLIFLNSNKLFITPYLSLYFILTIFGLLYFLPYFLYTQTYMAEVHQKTFTLIGKFSDFFDIFGFHNSRSSLSIAYFIRYLYGILFLVGFVKIVISSNRFKFPVIITVASVVLFLYPTWRYLLPIIPILYFTGMSFIKDISKYILRRIL